MDDKTTFKQALKISLMENQALEEKNAALELEVQRLAGENRIFFTGVVRA